MENQLLSGLVIINFSHPLTAAHRRQISELTDQPVREVVEVPVSFDTAGGFEEQVSTLIDQVPLSGEDWQTLPLMIVLPGLGSLGAVLLAALHGRMGHFPRIARIAPAAGGFGEAYQVAECIALQEVRDRARQRRFGQG